MAKNVGWKSVWTLYPASNLKRGLFRPFIFFIPTGIALFISSKNGYELVGLISSLIVTSFPSIIGFILAGYAILIGCSNSDLIRQLCKTDPSKRSSLFQRTSATFAIVMAMLILTFLIAFCSNLIFSANCAFVFSRGVRFFNYTFGLVLLYMSVYCIWSLIDITVNIFNYSQFINFQNADIEASVEESILRKITNWLKHLFKH